MANTVALTEQQIINLAYTVLEQDNTYWDPSSVEYATARGLLQVALGRWETYEGTQWKELFIKLSDAADGTKTTTALTFDYGCPTDMRSAPSLIGYVRTIRGGIAQFWKIATPEERARWANSNAFFCYFTGNPKLGYTLHFNPNVAQVTGDNIDYEYYKKAFITSAVGDTPELYDPYYLVYFIASHMSDGGLDPELFNVGEGLLDGMKLINMMGEDQIPMDTASDAGFGV